MVVFNRFSKSLHLIHFPSLSSAFEMSELIFTHLFWHYGIPEDTVSDQGAHFIPPVWSTFMEKLGVSVSLTSGYHPQVNVQLEMGQSRNKPVSASILCRHPVVPGPVPVMG